MPRRREVVPLTSLASTDRHRNLAWRWWRSWLAAGKCSDMGGLELASVIRELRAELNQALDDAQGERIVFELGPVEVSFTVTVGREGSPGAKVRFWVVEAGADAKVSRESVQEIKLVLTPAIPERRPARMGSSAAL
jgi:hypothetical protein